MKKILRILIIAVTIFLITVVAATVFLWHSLNSKLITNFLIEKLKVLKKQGIAVKISDLKVVRNFPSINIKIRQTSLNTNKTHIDIIDSDIKVNVLKLLAAKISSKEYYGEINVERVAATIAQKTTKRQFPTIHPIQFPKIPYIPVDLKIPQAIVKFGNVLLAGKISIENNIFNKNNIVYFKGTINRLPVNLKITLLKDKIKFSLFLPTITQMGISMINVGLDGVIDKTFRTTISANCDIVSTKYILIQEPNIKATVSLLQKGLNISDFTLYSINGYNATLKGIINVNNIFKSTLKGRLSTPYIDISKFIPLLPNKVRPYIKNGKIKLDYVSFSGEPSFEFIKDGVAHAKDVQFRIGRNSPFFLINKAIVKISPQKIKAIAVGSFSSVKLTKSIFVLYRRKKGLVSDIHLDLYGQASETVRRLLDEDILSKEDVQTLGKTRNLKGKIKAHIDIIGYRFKPLPRFDFNIKLYTNGIEFINSNIPNGWIKSTGFVDIVRKTKGGKTRKLYIKLKNLTAVTKGSIFKTKNFTLIIKPTLGFYGDFDVKLSRNELSQLEMDIAKKKDPLKISQVVFKGKINGTKNNFSFASNFIVPLKIRGISLKGKITGQYSTPLLKIDKLEIKGIGNVETSGLINTKVGKIKNISLKIKNLYLSKVKNFIPKPIPVTGILTGNVNLKFTNNKPYISQFLLNIRNGKVFFIDNLTADIKSKEGNLIEFYNTSFDISKNKIIAKGSYDIRGNTLNLKLYSTKFTLDTSNLAKTKKVSGTNISINIPKIKINAKFDIMKLILRFNKKIKDLKTASIVFISNSNKTLTNLQSALSRWKIEFNRITKVINVKVRDWAMWPFLTGCNNPKNYAQITATLRTSSPDSISIGNLNGDIYFWAKNGCISNAPSSLNLISLLNPFTSLVKGFGVKKGIEYKKIEAKLKLHNGVIKTKKNEAAVLDGKNIDLFAYGKYDILKDKIDVYVTFITFSTINKIVSHIPIIGWIIGGKNKSFTGLSFHVYGNPSNPSIKPVPFRSLAKGVLGVVKRTLMLPLSIFGVK